MHETVTEKDPVVIRRSVQRKPDGTTYTQVESVKEIVIEKAIVKESNEESNEE